MQQITIRSFEGSDICVRSPSELAAALKALSAEHRHEPLLIYLYGESGNVMIFGIGAAHTTIELIAGDRHFRSLGSTPPAPESIPFIFQGELTEVEPKYLISQADGERAALAWFEGRGLDDTIAWRDDPFPPRSGSGR